MCVIVYDHHVTRFLPLLHFFVSKVTHQLTHSNAALLALGVGYMAQAVHISPAVNTTAFWFLSVDVLSQRSLFFD